MQWANRTWYPPASTAQESTNYLDLMKQILDKGADPNVQIKKKVWFRRFHDDWIDSPGATAFWRAAQANDLSAMKLLIAHGANPNLMTTHNATALEVAAGYGFEDQLSSIVPRKRFEVVKYLVDELHMDVNAHDDMGYTPLHGAAYVGENGVVDYLVTKGADVHAKSHGIIQQEGQTVFEAAPGGGDTVADMANGPRTHGIQHPDTVKLLESLGSANSHNCRSAVCLPGTSSTRQ
jgi:ankyrin repeat protein